MKLPYIYLLLVFIGFSTKCLSQQTGVLTKNPQGVLHIDAAKDNNTSGAPSIAEQANDVIISNTTGNMGIGTITTNTKLNINSAIPGAIRIVDGKEGIGRVLQSDRDGNGQWTLHPVMRLNVLGTFPSTASSVNSGGASSYLYSGVSIILTEGNWIVNAGLTFVNVGNNGSGNRLQVDYWQRAYISSSNTTLSTSGFAHLGPAGNNSAYGGIMHGTDANSRRIGFISGSCIINVPTGTTINLYLMLQNQPAKYYFYSSSHLENFFYALPL